MSDASPRTDGSRWPFIRDVVVFQLKLVLDGLRDAVLIPLSVAAAVVDLLTPGPEERGLFHRLLDLGRRSEDFIDLFEVARRGRLEAADSPRGTGVDDLLRPVEDYLRAQERQGGLTASAREQVDRLLDTVSRARDRG